jgi:radical SAM protein with 4Fe4S-binding SPASM domain
MECPHIPVINYGDFSKRFHERVADKRIPITGSIEVTARCNLRCVHCYINLPLNDRTAQEKELTYKEFCNIIDQIVDEGCLWLLLTGGEPFIRQDFLDIYIYAKKKGLLITVFTNGTTITPRIADYLAEWRPFSLEITLYGRTKKIYESVTGVPGSYEKCMQGIELLLQRKIPLKLKTMVMTLNKHEIWDMKKYAEELGVEFRFDPVLNMRIDGDHKPADFRISPEEVVDLDLNDEKRIKEWREFCDKFGGAPQNPEYIYQCGAGKGTFHIDPYGKLSACMMTRYSSFDLREDSFIRGWQEFIPDVLSQKWLKETPCKTCELLSLCGQCPGFAKMEYGRQEEQVEYLCQIAHMRAEAFGLASLEKGGKR